MFDEVEHSKKTKATEPKYIIAWLMFFSLSDSSAASFIANHVAMGTLGHESGHFTDRKHI